MHLQKVVPNIIGSTINTTAIPITRIHIFIPTSNMLSLEAYAIDETNTMTYFTISESFRHSKIGTKKKL